MSRRGGQACRSYVEITNKGTDADTLIGITTPAVGKPMLHETVVTDGLASMPHAMSVPFPAVDTVKLAPGGCPDMLMGLPAPLKEGDVYPLALTFGRAGEVKVNVDVVSIRAEGPTRDGRQ